jgi:hypothetical protein
MIEDKYAKIERESGHYGHVVDMMYRYIGLALAITSTLAIGEKSAIPRR